MSGTTPAESTTPLNPIPLTSTWFSRVGLRPYELLEPTCAAPIDFPYTRIPAHILAA